jgi:hypothetical protein
MSILPGRQIPMLHFSAFLLSFASRCGRAYFLLIQFVNYSGGHFLARSISLPAFPARFYAEKAKHESISRHQITRCSSVELRRWKGDRALVETAATEAD